MKENNGLILTSSSFREKSTSSTTNEHKIKQDINALMKSGLLEEKEYSIGDRSAHASLERTDENTPSTR